MKYYFIVFCNKSPWAVAAEGLAPACYNHLLYLMRKDIESLRALSFYAVRVMTMRGATSRGAATVKLRPVLRP